MKYKLFSGYTFGDGFWFRIFGFGIFIAHHEKNPPLFSERIGIVKSLVICGYRVRFLTR